MNNSQAETAKTLQCISRHMLQCIATKCWPTIMSQCSWKIKKI